MPDELPVMPAGPQLEIQPDKPPINLEARGRLLAEDHRRQSKVFDSALPGSSGGDDRSLDSVSLLSARIPRFTAILKEAASRLQAQTSQAGQHSPAAEWLLDNYYIVAQVLRESQFLQRAAASSILDDAVVINLNIQHQLWD